MVGNRYERRECRDAAGLANRGGDVANDKPTGVGKPGGEMANISSTGHAQQLDDVTSIDDRLIGNDLRYQVVNERLSPRRKERAGLGCILGRHQTDDELLEKTVPGKIASGFGDETGVLLGKYWSVGECPHPHPGTLPIPRAHAGSDFAPPDAEKPAKTLDAVFNPQQVTKHADTCDEISPAIWNLSEDLVAEYGIGCIGVYCIKDRPDALHLFVVPVNSESVEIGRTVGPGHG
jgi:hypothetical protein